MRLLSLKANQDCMCGVHDMPNKEILRRSIFLSKQTTAYVQTCIASVYGQGPVHTDLSQNMSVERDCRTGRHVYEALIQIFKLTLLEKGFKPSEQNVWFLIVSSSIFYDHMHRCIHLCLIYIV